MKPQALRAFDIHGRMLYNDNLIIDIAVVEVLGYRVRLLPFFTRFHTWKGLFYGSTLNTVLTSVILA